MFRLNQIIFSTAVNTSKKSQLVESEIAKTAKRVTASALESKFKCWVPGGRNHSKMSKAVEAFLAKHPPKK